MRGASFSLNMNQSLFLCASEAVILLMRRPADEPRRPSSKQAGVQETGSTERPVLRLPRKERVLEPSRQAEVQMPAQAREPGKLENPSKLMSHM